MLCYLLTESEKKLKLRSSSSGVTDGVSGGGPGRRRRVPAPCSQLGHGVLC